MMRWLILIASLTGTLATASSAAQPLKIIQPRDQATVLVDSVIELAVAPPAGASVVRIEISIDGKLHETLTAPPWRSRWNAGPEGGHHVVRARLLLSNGEEFDAWVRTSPLRIDQIEEVALVNVYAIAKDPDGGYVTDLRMDELRLYENGRPQMIDRFSAERKPLRIGLVLDTSLSMKGDKLSAAKNAAASLLDVLEEGDEGFVIAFNDRARVLQDLTGDAGKLEQAIEAVGAVGGTALYDAVWEAADRLGAFDGRRVIVLLSDGRDEAASGLEPGSLHTLEEATDRALRQEVMVFTIGLGHSLSRDARRLEDDPRAAVAELDFFGRESLVTILKRLSDTTGGRAIFSSGPSRLKKAFAEVADDLRHQYSLAYSSDDRRHDGSWREIRLVTARPGVTIVNRKGYFAPKAAMARPPRRTPQPTTGVPPAP